MNRHLKPIYNDMLLVSLAKEEYEDCDTLLEENTDDVINLITNTYFNYPKMYDYINTGCATIEETIIFELLNYTLELDDSEIASLKENLSDENKLKYELLKMEV